MCKLSSFIAEQAAFSTAVYLAVLSKQKIGGFLLAVLTDENLLRLFYCMAFGVSGLWQNERFN